MSMNWIEVSWYRQRVHRYVQNLGFFIVALNDVLNLLISSYWKFVPCIMYAGFCNIKVHSVLTVLYGHVTLFY